MSFVQPQANPAATGVAVIDSPSSLDAFLAPNCAAAVWRRQTPQDVQHWLDELDPDLLPTGRVILRREAVAEVLSNLCDIAKTPSGPERGWLEADVADLAGLFSTLLSASHLRLRLDRVTGNACRRFHIDALTARLVCTYRGPGTQYGLSDGEQDPERVFTANPGAPLLLKGSLWPDEPSEHLLHRSPPIEGTGQTRFVLVLDPVYDPKAEA